MKNYIHIFLIICVLSLSSCASISNKISREESTKLTKKNIHAIEGTYEFLPYKSFGTDGKRVYNLSGNIKNIDQYLIGEEIAFISKSDYTVEIKLVSQDEISFSFKNRNTLVYETTIKMKLKSNGLIYLDNKYVKTTGIPFIFGGIIVSKIHVGITKEGDFLLNYTHDSFASILIMVGGHSYNNRHYYKKINTSP